MVLQYIPLSFQPYLGDWYVLDDSDDELYEPLMDDNESNAISDLLVYLENVRSSSPSEAASYQSRSLYLLELILMA